MYRMPRHPSSASPFLGLYPTVLVLEDQGKFLALSDLDEHSYKEESIVTGFPQKFNSTIP